MEICCSHINGAVILNKEVVLLFRPDCSPVKVDQGFTSGCHFHGLRFAGMELVGGQYAMDRVGPLGVVIGQPLADTLPIFECSFSISASFPCPGSAPRRVKA